jgi:hypothetical protein
MFTVQFQSLQKLKTSHIPKEMSQTYTVELGDNRTFEFEGTEEFAIGVGLAIFRWEAPDDIDTFEPAIPIFERNARNGHRAISDEINKYIVECDAEGPMRGARELSSDQESKMVADEVYFADHFHPFANDVTLKLSKGVLDGLEYGFVLLKSKGRLAVFHDGKEVWKTQDTSVKQTK